MKSEQIFPLLILGGIAIAIFLFRDKIAAAVSDFGGGGGIQLPTAAGGSIIAAAPISAAPISAAPISAVSKILYQGTYVTPRSTRTLPGTSLRTGTVNVTGTTKTGIATIVGKTSVASVIVPKGYSSGINILNTLLAGKKGGLI